MPQNGSSWVPTLTFDAVPRNLAAIRRFVRIALAELGARDGDIDDLVQAVDESATNVIVHGYRGGGGPLEVEAARQGRDVVMVLRDRAPRFDPTNLPAPDTSTPFLARRPGGFGVFLSRELVDEVRHRDAPAGGNELLLIKRNSVDTDTQRR